MTDEIQKQEETLKKDESNIQKITEVNGLPIIENLTKLDKKKTHGLRGKKKKMIERLVARLGVVSSACKDVDISRQVHYDWLKNDSIYKNAYNEMEFLVQDVIETAFLSLVIDKNPAVVIHGAKTKLKERGYGDRLELEHSGNLGVVFNIVEKSVEEIKNARPNNNTQAEGNPTSP